ncbi:ribosome-associated heat shock protein Hsp15 [Parendozoicomonas haliclonae]|uniref:Heat shock protein 15 n=1 Tax=Parendozoicomonas haliclonae TaxID=1960125 RepID=A0A1X7AIV9_9GAMM|nr:ribosome-associated heat shock protein Hsp15 [Parendozoicomonas haliclonae]SMA45618.1 Heat shock protein 15 [Parendozoicomonas haliclonae]
MSKRNASDSDNQKVRLDKWLWAARFYKTRSLCRDAIEGGKVHVNGQRAKPSKDARVGDILVLRQGFDEKTVVIEELSDDRRGAVEAQKLYRETEESLQKREQEAARRKAFRGSNPMLERRPDKKERRDIHKLRQMDYDND